MSAQAFRRVAIVNRGEPAMRLINAVREWNAQGLAPLRTIAIYTAVDRTAMFVREADEAVLIGPDDPEYMGPSTLPRLRRAAAGPSRLARADAVWPGWGFVSEKAEFAQLCRDMGIVFVGPSPEVMRAARRQDRLQAARRGGRRPDGGVVQRAGRRHRRGARARRDASATPSWSRPPRAAAAAASGRSSGPEELAEAFDARLLRGRRRPRATPRCSSSARCAAAGTSRCRSSRTPPATSGRWACATAACSGATRR